jgi:hypothetical protein
VSVIGEDVKARMRQCRVILLLRRVEVTSVLRVVIDTSNHGGRSAGFPIIRHAKSIELCSRNIALRRLAMQISILIEQLQGVLI